AHLLEQDRQLDVGEPGAAVLLRDVHGLPSEVGDLLPHRSVVAFLGLHQLAHDLRRRLVLEEAPGAVSEFLLLLAEGEVHVWHPLPNLWSGGGVSQKLDRSVKSGVRTSNHAPDRPDRSWTTFGAVRSVRPS